MKGLKRLLLVCMLMICVVFSLTACDKSSNTNDIKVGNEVHAEESAPPIEYWLETKHKKAVNHKYSATENYFPTVDHGGEGSYQAGMCWSIVSVYGKGSYYPEKSLKNLDIVKYFPFDLKTYERYHWADSLIDTDYYYYKDGRFIKKRNIIKTECRKHGNDLYNDYLRIRKNDFFEGEGLYIFKINKFRARGAQYGGRGKWVVPTYNGSSLEDCVFAVQIGNDDFCDNFKG